MTHLCDVHFTNTKQKYSLMRAPSMRRTLLLLVTSSISGVESHGYLKSPRYAREDTSSSPLKMTLAICLSMQKICAYGTSLSRFICSSHAMAPLLKVSQLHRFAGRCLVRRNFFRQLPYGNLPSLSQSRWYCRSVWHRGRQKLRRQLEFRGPTHASFPPS